MLCLEMVDIIIFLINILMSILFNNSFKKYESMMLIDGDKVDEHVKIITPKQRDVNYKISETKHILGMTKLYGVFYQLIKCFQLKRSRILAVITSIITMIQYYILYLLFFNEHKIPPQIETNKKPIQFFDNSISDTKNNILKPNNPPKKHILMYI